MEIFFAYFRPVSHFSFGVIKERAKGGGGVGGCLPGSHKKLETRTATPRSFGRGHRWAVCLKAGEDHSAGTNMDSARENEEINHISRQSDTGA